MNILFISNDLIAGDLARILRNEGNKVKLYIHDKKRRRNFHNIVDVIDNWKKEIKWVGKDGLIIFDDVGFGKIQDNLRKEGYKVFGGSEIGDKLEQDRVFGQMTFEKYGLKTVQLENFDDIDSAIKFVKNNPAAWVIKQNNHHYSKVLNHVGEFEDGRDVIDILSNIQHNKKYKKEKISLQKKIFGVEIGVGRYFNGTDWVGPIEYNIEHTRLFPQDIGPLTSEMGTLAWYDSNEDNKLYRETLYKMKEYLKEINFRGDFEINCIVNESGAYPLEATSRFGSPIIHLHKELHISPWGEFLMAIASGNSYNLQWKKGYGIVTLLAAPPFPYGSDNEDNALVEGTAVYIRDMNLSDLSHIHFEEISMKADGSYYISDTRGYILYVTYCSQSVKEAQVGVSNIIKKIYFPKMIYRNDIGSSFIEENEQKLRQWHYIE